MADIILTTSEAAKRLRCSKGQLSKLMNGKVKDAPPLKSIRLGRRRFIFESTLNEFARKAEA